MKTMMPLSELRSNHPARNGNGQSQDDFQDDRSRTVTPNGDENVDILKNPSSIQSMLRNTTETGNVGQFSIKPSRLPPSLPRPSKARLTPSKQRQLGAYYNRSEDGSVRQIQSHSRKAKTASNGSGFQTHIPRPYPGPARSPSIEDYRSSSTTKSFYGNHNVTPRHPHNNGVYVGQGGPHNLRPRSPFAYPTRLKRPGYRPSSPALSDFNKQNRSQTSLYRRPSFRTNSPSSLHTTGAPSPWRKGVNRSDPMLRFYSQSAVPTSGRAPSPSLVSTRPTTPKGSPSLKSITSSANGLQATSNGSWINPQSPIFYDYTEAFEERGFEQQDYSHYVSMSTGTLAEPPLLDTAPTTYYELDASPESTSRTELTSENSPSKLETQATAHRFDQTTSHFEVNNRSSIQELHIDLSEVPELPEGDMSNAEIDVPPAKHDDGPLDQKFQFPLEKASPLMAVAEHPKQSLEQRKPRESVSITENTASPSQVSENPNQDRFSPVGSIHSAHPNPQTMSVSEDSSPEDPKTTSSTETSPPPIVRQAADSHLGDGHVGNKPRSVQMARASSFEDHSGYESIVTEIISPTPERSMTSPTSVSRFSKILSINEDMLDLDELANRIKGKDRSDSPMQGIIDSKARAARIEPAWRKRSVQLRDIASRQNAADYALVEASDSEDEPELTQGLRQTFCKSEDRPMNHLPGSPPITLPSQLVHRGYPGPLSIRRSPAVRRSTSDLRKVRDPPNADPEQDLGPPEGSVTYSKPSLEAKQSSPVHVDANRDLESSRKPSNEERSTLNTMPLPPLLPPPDKELPSLPNERPAIVALSPPVTPRLPSLPFSFTPLIHRKSEDETTSAADLDAVASSYMHQSEETREDKDTAAPVSATNNSPDRRSIASSPDSRPWMLDTSYPWSDQQPKLEVTIPEGSEDANRSNGSSPQFRLKVQRASSTTEGTGKLTKCPHISDSSGLLTTSHDIFQGTTFRRNIYPNLSAMPGQINSSHDVIRSSPNQTRFVESFEIQSPRITLVPPSPGFEARSFFSDDSSQVQPRGTIRKRISALRNRRSRGASADEPRGYDRGLLSSALGLSRASGRTSRQSQNTAITAGASSRASQSKRARRKLVNKLRSWWQRGEDRVREWRWRRRYNGAIGRSMSADLYAGV